MSEKNFMDNFKTPEEFIRFQLTCHNALIYKKDLVKFARDNGARVNSRMKSLEVYNAVRDVMTLEELLDRLQLAGMGVSSYSFQLKFNVTHEEVRRMARLGFIEITGKSRFTAYGKLCTADLYSVFDYFRLTKEEVHGFLALNPKGTRKNKKTGD